MADNHQAKFKPLFASATNISCSTRRDNDEIREDATKDLENLNFSLASSTLEAILAAQQLPIQKTSSVLNRDQSSGEDETEIIQPASPVDDELSSHYSGSRKRKHSQERHKHKKKKKHKHKKNERRNHSPPERRRSPSPSPIAQMHKGKVFIDDIPNMTERSAFTVDKKANKNLRVYESVSKLHIAKYHLAFNSCIGNPKVFADRPSKNWTKKFKATQERYFSRDQVKIARRSGSNCHCGIKEISHQPEFIKIPKENEGKKTNNSVGSYNCLDEATMLYVQGKGKQTTEAAPGDDFVRDEIFEKVAVYNKRTREDPNNVNLWLEFVEFQNVVALEDKSFKKQILHLYDVYRPSQSVIDKKLAILEKAVELNPSSLDLKKAQLELYQDVWEADKVEKAWEDLLFIHSSNVDLWRSYLYRQQSRLSTFSFTQTVKKYHKCFQTLIPILEDQVKVVNKSDHLEEKLIGLFHQYCSFLHQSGYTERAVSSYQAIIEMNLFCPSNLNLTSTRERLVKMEAFWDSWVPKFGDLQARGWTEWESRQAEKNRGGGFPSASTEEEEDKLVLAGLPKSLTWLRMEKARQDTFWLPWKPDTAKGETEENCEDPDRLVLFEDISLALFRVSKSESCLQLVCLFLSFLGMNTGRLESVLLEVEGFHKAEFSGSHLTKLNQIQGTVLVNLGIDVDAKWTPHQSLVDFVQQVIIQAENFFSATKQEFFTLLRLELELQKTGEVNIQGLSSTNRKELKKFGKNLLKEKSNRNNLVVWDAYIRVLWVLSDKMEETMTMIDTALAMFTGFSLLSDIVKARGLCLLCRTYAEIMLNFEPLEHVVIKGRLTAPSLKDKQQVIGCMGALVEGTKFKPHSKVDISQVYILRIRKRMTNMLDGFISNIETDSLSMHDVTLILTAFVQCSALFEYCADSFQNASEVFTTARQSLKAIQCLDPKKGAEIEFLLRNLYQANVFFISNVMHVESLPLSHLRNVLDSSLQDFPTDSYFHKALCEVESGSFIMGRLRKFYDRQLKSSPSSNIIVFALLSELNRLESILQLENTSSEVSDTGFVHRIRSLFEHSLELPVCSHCPLLWRMWLAFETKHGMSSSVKGILYRGLQSCPWAKCLYLAGVECLGEEELQEMCDLMTEKEIRVCMPLEEVELLLTAEKESEGEGEDIQNDLP